MQKYIRYVYVKKEKNKNVKTPAHLSKKALHGSKHTTSLGEKRKKKNNMSRTRLNNIKQNKK